MPLPRPKLAVYKFASCDGCQIALLNLEDELVQLAGTIDIAYFPEATSATVAGPYDLVLIEGSVTTAADRERIVRVRQQSRFLVAIGACATAGGIQALRNYADIGEYRRAVYPASAQLDCLRDSTPVSNHVPVDFELHGCPVSSQQLLEVITAILHQRQPQLPGHAVCVECKRRGNTCVLIARGTPCLGPLTRAGCGALCPQWGRGCYACFGPMENANPEALIAQLRKNGVPDDAILRMLRAFTGFSPVFRAATEQLEGQMA
jgi:sulfhydrogenase subunit delta